MTAVTFTGLSSGIDTSSLVTQLVAAERAPANVIASRQSDLNTESLSLAVDSLLSNPAKLSTMRAKALDRARPTAAADIAQHILRLVEREQMRR